MLALKIPNACPSLGRNSKNRISKVIMNKTIVIVSITFPNIFLIIKEV